MLSVLPSFSARFTRSSVTAWQGLPPRPPDPPAGQLRRKEGGRGAEGLAMGEKLPDGAVRFLRRKGGPRFRRQPEKKAPAPTVSVPPGMDGLTGPWPPLARPAAAKSNA